jgi:hypothetical protein
MIFVIWAVAFLVILGAGVPAAGWWVSRRPRPLDTGDRAHGEIDRWLAGQFGLGWRERSRVQGAVFAGRPLTDPGLEAAARRLAAQVLDDRFRTLRVARRVGWLRLVSGGAYLVFAVVFLIISHRATELALAVLAVLNGGLMIVAGVFHTFQNPWRIRRNAETVLRSGENAPQRP